MKIKSDFPHRKQSHRFTKHTLKKHVKTVLKHLKSYKLSIYQIGNELYFNILLFFGDISQGIDRFKG